MRPASSDNRESPKGIWRQPRYLIAGGVVTVSVAIGAYLLWPSSSVLDASTVHQAKFPVYAPTSAPKGFSLQKNHTVVTDSTVTYSFVNQENDIITVTVQPRPSSLDMRQMVEGGSVKSTILSSGTLYDLSVGGASKFLLDMGDSLVFITSAQSISTTTINSLASDLRRSN